MQKYIGRQLKTARQNKKLTQEQIAEAVGLSAKHYGCIERGEVSTTVAVLTRLQQAAGCCCKGICRVFSEE